MTKLTIAIFRLDDSEQTKKSRESKEKKVLYFIPLDLDTSIHNVRLYEHRIPIHEGHMVEPDQSMSF